MEKGVALPKGFEQEIEEIWSSVKIPLPPPLNDYDTCRLALLIGELIGKMMGKPFSEVLKTKRHTMLITLAAAQAFKEGKKIDDTEIARRLNVSRQTVGRSWKEHKK